MKMLLRQDDASPDKVDEHSGGNTATASESISMTKDHLYILFYLIFSF